MFTYPYAQPISLPLLTLIHMSIKEHLCPNVLDSLVKQSVSFENGIEGFDVRFDSFGESWVCRLICWRTSE